jgi:hypothetical protein
MMLELVNQQTLTSEERELCDYFLDEYSKDYDVDKALYRMGVDTYKLTEARAFFFSKQYVKKVMAQDTPLVLPTEQNSVEKAFKFVASNLVKIVEKGKTRDKLVALEQISKMYGLNDPHETSNSATTNVIQIPTNVSDAEWEEQAQVKMAENMRED